MNDKEKDEEEKETSEGESEEETEETDKEEGSEDKEDSNVEEGEKGEKEDSSEEQKGKGGPDKAPSSQSRRRSKESQKTKSSVKSVVPMWLWIVSVVILLGFSGALMFRYESQLKKKDDKFNSLETQAQNKIADLNELVDEKRGIIKDQDNQISTLSLEKRRLASQAADLTSETNANKKIPP